MRVRFQSLSGVQEADARTWSALQGILDQLQLTCERDYRNLQLPPLYASGVRYRPQPTNPEYWPSSAEIYGRMHDDCNGLAASRAAELVVYAVDPSARATLRPVSRTLAHASVKRAGGKWWEDPSAVLGMRSKPMELRWKFRKVAGGWTAEISVPLVGGPLVVEATAATGADALWSALQVVRDWLEKHGAFAELAGMTSTRLVAVRGLELPIHRQLRAASNEGSPPQRVGASPELAPVDLFRRDIALARFQVEDWAAKAGAVYRPIAGAVEAGRAIYERLGHLNTANDVLAAWDSLASIAAMAGPVGAGFGWFMKAVSDVARALTENAPARAIQMQSQDYAHLENWYAMNVLGIPDTEDVKAFQTARAMGWHAIIIPPGGSFGRASGGILQMWRGDDLGVIPTDLETNLQLFSIIAGPRPEAPPVELSLNALRPWIDSDEGRASMAEGRKVADALVGDRGWHEMALQNGGALAHISDGLIFVNRIKHNIAGSWNPYDVWIQAVLINEKRLPDDVLVPLVMLGHLETEARQASNSERLTNDEKKEIRAAAFGPNDEAVKRQGLLRYLPIAYPAGMAEVARRNPEGAELRPGAQPLAPTATPPATPGARTPSTTRPIGRVSMPRVRVPTAGPIARTLEQAADQATPSNIPAAAPPQLAPVTAEKLVTMEQITQPGLMGDLVALHRLAQAGPNDPISKLARALLSTAR